MSEHLAFQRAIVDKAETLLHVLAAEILVDGGALASRNICRRAGTNCGRDLCGRHHL